MFTKDWFKKTFVTRRPPVRKALFVGINYPNTPNQLNGCINDVLLWNEVLTNRFGFTENINKRMLTDNSATTANILERLYWLVEGAREGDILFFTYSGHGSQTICTDYTKQFEDDGVDEILCPSDLNWRDKMIRDDDLHKIFKDVPKGVNLTIVLDCCHSGDGIRNISNPYSFSQSPNKSKFIPMPVDIANRGYGKDLKPKVKDIKNKYNEQIGILISGCASNQTSADAWIHNRYNGALTYFLNETLAQYNYDIDYFSLVESTKNKLHEYGYSQTPELNCSDENMFKKFLK